MKKQKSKPKENDTLVRTNIIRRNEDSGEMMEREQEDDSDEEDFD